MTFEDAAFSAGDCGMTAAAKSGSEDELDDAALAAGFSGISAGVEPEPEEASEGMVPFPAVDASELSSGVDAPNLTADVEEREPSVEAPE